MKKSLILAGMMSIGIAYAQEYDERVGVNTQTPSATLNVKTKNNTKTPKNLELENQSGTKLVTVLNNGRVGINTEEPTEMLHIKNGKLLSEGGNSGVIIRRETEVGPFIQLENPSKKIVEGTASGQEPVSKWRIFNMGGYYGNSLRIWAYGTNESGNEVGLKSRVTIADNGNLGIGEFPVGRLPTEKLHIEVGNVKINDLPTTVGGTTDKLVVVDNTGVLKSVDRSSITATPAVEVGSTKSMKCDVTNRGKMNFVKNDNGSDIFGICLRNKDGNYYWGLLTGGGNLTTGGATFGE